MGLILKKYVDDDCLLGIWEIIEDYDTLFFKVNLDSNEKNILNSFQNYQRKLEWLSVRVLINELMEKECRIVYNELHKPSLDGCIHNISISHSKNLTSIMVSKNKQVGIDLEYMSHQIRRVAHKFINDDEVISNLVEKQRVHLYIHWCAKEAIYKICDKQDINFKQNLTIIPFEIEEEGIIYGKLHNRLSQELFKLNYFFIDGYVVVWCNK